MKKGIILSAMLLVAGMMFAQQAVITFTKTEHDFGKINEADGKVTTVFEFKNEGMEPLVLSQVRASCGCTTPSWTKEPVEPGQTGTINVTYNPNGRPGRFQKTITVTSNATESTKKLYIKGEVIPKSAQPVNKYPVKVGKLGLAANTLNFGTVLKNGKHVVKDIEYANLESDEPLAVGVDLFNTPVAAEANMPSIEKGKSGKLQVRLDPQFLDWGPQELVISLWAGKDKKSAERQTIVISVNVEEDFSALTADQRQSAPILSCPKTVTLGEITPGKKVKKTFKFKNVGADPLNVRCVVNQSKNIFTASAKGSIKTGKTGTVTIEIDGKEKGQPMKPGTYQRIITLMTNDPKNPKQQITISWTIK